MLGRLRQPFSWGGAKLLLWLLSYKALVLAIALLYGFLPETFDLDRYKTNFHRHEQPGFNARFSTWDAEHYLSLSENGYHPGLPSAAFYPLWPGLVRITGSMMGGHFLLASLLLANAFSLVAWMLFHRLISEIKGAKVANFALALLLAYPGSLFYQFPYSEALFLLLIILFFMGLGRANYWLVALTGFLLPLTRATGIFCLIVLVLHLWERINEQSTDAIDRFTGDWFNALLKQKPALLTCGAPILGYASYFSVMWFMTGNPFEGFEAQQYYINKPSIANIFDLPGFIAAFFDVGWFHDTKDSPIDRAMFILFIFCLPYLWRWNKAYFLYAIGSGLVPAMSNWFFSYTRLLVLCFPLFVVLADNLKERKNRFYFWLVMAVFATIQISFVVRHVNFRWAG